MHAPSLRLSYLIYMQIPVQGPLFRKLYNIQQFFMCHDRGLERRGGVSWIYGEVCRLNSDVLFCIVWKK